MSSNKHYGVAALILVVVIDPPVILRTAVTVHCVVVFPLIVIVRIFNIS